MFDDERASHNKVKEKATVVWPLKKTQNILTLKNASFTDKTNHKGRITNRNKVDTKKSLLETILLDHILPTPKKIETKQKATVENVPRQRQQQQQQLKVDHNISAISALDKKQATREKENQFTYNNNIRSIYSSTSPRQVTSRIDRIEESRKNELIEQDKAYITDHRTNKVAVIPQIPDRIEIARERKPEQQTDLGGTNTNIESTCMNSISERISEVNPSMKSETNVMVNPKQIITNPATPKLDQRTVRLLHANKFETLRQQSSEYVRKFLVGNKIVESKQPGMKNNVRFVVRFTPLSDFDVERGNFGIVELSEDCSTIVALYEASILPDLMTLDLKAHLFQFDAVFSEKVSFDFFYIRSGLQDLVRETLNGGLGTIIIFGGNNYGKSNTTSDMFNRVGFDIFFNARKSNCSVFVKYLGFNSNRCIDLLGPIGSVTKLVKSEGGYETKGVVEAGISSTKELLDMLSDAKQRLVTEMIVQQEDKINNYLLCQIIIKIGNGEAGCLSLLVCPCDDGVPALEFDYKKIDPLAHVMDITRSMASAKNCCTSESQKLRNVTKLLPQSVVNNKELNICFVAAMSSSSVDTEAIIGKMLSLKTLKNEMNGNLQYNKKLFKKEVCGKVSEAENDLILPRQWSKIQLLNWLTKKNLIAGELLDKSEKLSGKCVMQMTKQQLKHSFYKSTEDGDNKAGKLFAALRGENDRIARLRVKRKFVLQQQKN